MRNEHTEARERRECRKRLSKVADKTIAGGSWAQIEVSMWTECMLSALGNGVKGCKWLSLNGADQMRPSRRSGVRNHTARQSARQPR